MKIYVATVEVLRKNERQGETQIIIEIPLPPLNINVLFYKKKIKNLTLFMTKLSVLMLYIF